MQRFCKAVPRRGLDLEVDPGRPGAAAAQKGPGVLQQGRDRLPLERHTKLRRAAQTEAKRGQESQGFGQPLSANPASDVL